VIKVLVVDDSAFMRRVLTDIFLTEKDIVVIGTAVNGKDAIDKVKKLKPDVITLDIEMPIMNGFEALEMIMKENPTPVVMVSSLTKAHAEATIRSLNLGAVDFIAKEGGSISTVNNIRDDVIAKCRMAAKVNVKFLKKTSLSSIRPTSAFTGSGSKKIVAIGTSTGGPRALQEVITRLPKNFPCGIVIVQHMPPGFTKSLAERLDSISELSVKEAENNDSVVPGSVLIAPGSYHMVVENSLNPVVKLNNNPLVNGHRPSADPLLESVAKIFGPKAVGVILTGMGRDGANGMEAIKKQKGYTIAESQATSVVFGMPKAAIDLGVVDVVAPITEVASEIMRAVKT
jgi:two-component system chemotaxis response regulator CheB